MRQLLIICFLGLNSKRQYRSSEKEKESRCLVFASSAKRESVGKEIFKKACFASRIVAVAISPYCRTSAPSILFRLQFTAGDKVEVK